MSLSRSQKIVVALGRMVSGLLSVVSSSLIIHKVNLLRREQKTANNVTNPNSKVTTYHRLLVGMSLLDILQSMAAVIGTLAVPASTGVVWGFGTVASCSAQGFFSQIASAVPVYTASLNTYFMLRIRYNVPDGVVRDHYERWFHGVPLVFAVASSSLGVVLQIFNPSALPEIGCWIERYPVNCHLSGNCTRGYKIGEWLDMYVWVFCYGWLFLSFAVVLVNSVLINTAIRKQERRNSIYGAVVRLPERASTLSSHTIPTDDNPSRKPERRWSDGSSFLTAMGARREQAGSNRSLQSTNTTEITSQRRGRIRVKASRVAAVQSALYCTATFFTAIWMFMPWLGSKIGVSARTTFFFAFMINIIAPSQGLVNLCIFLRLQYNRLRESEREWSRYRCIVECLTSPATTT